MYRDVYGDEIGNGFGNRAAFRGADHAVLHEHDAHVLASIVLLHASQRHDIFQVSFVPGTVPDQVHDVVFCHISSPYNRNAAPALDSIAASSAREMVCNLPYDRKSSCPRPASSSASCTTRISRSLKSAISITVS